MFSKKEQEALEVFVTSATDQIYAIRSTVPPEVFGSFGSFFSRNPKDFREHLLDAITGKILGHENSEGETNLNSLTDGTFRDPSYAIHSGLNKAQEFFSTWYGKYSHKSIANTVWIPMVATNVSQLFARELAYDQLAFFIEQSTRYVHFDISRMYIDPNVNRSATASVYRDTLEALGHAYEELTDRVERFYTNQTTFEEWKRQNNLTNKGKDLDKRYHRELRGKALDVSRFLLPQAILTNIAWILDARSYEFDIAAWKGHPLAEIRDAAALIEKHTGMIAPSLLKYTSTNSYYGRRLQRKNITNPQLNEQFEKGIDIISYDQDALNKTVANLLKRYGTGGNWRRYYEIARGLYFKQKIAFLRQIVADRDRFDEWVEMDEDFDLVKIAFEIRTDIGAIRDWRRHQKWDRGESLYTLENGIHRPKILSDMGTEVGAIFDNAIERAYNGERTLRKVGLVFEAQYVVPMATMHALTLSGGLDQLQYLLWTRTTPQGNFSYREDAFALAEAVLHVHPWLLGYERYPEGKTLKEVYDNAPLKGLLRLQLGEEELHR